MTLLAEQALATVNLNGGKLIGKTRIQKSVYFLESLGFGYGFHFEYYHYGPYSEDLSRSLDDCEVRGMLKVEWGRTQSGTEYAIYNSSHEHPECDEHDKDRRSILKILEGYDSVSLELAATADFLSKNGFSNDPWSETSARKPEKSTDFRINKAKKLLEELGEFS